MSRTNFFAGAHHFVASNNTFNDWEWNAHQSTMNNRFIIPCLVATWHLEWMSANGMDGEDLLCTVTMLGVATIRQPCVVGVVG